jgi:GT2 family glycosyltransferase
MGSWARLAQDRAGPILLAGSRALREVAAGWRERLYRAGGAHSRLLRLLYPGIPLSRDPRYQEWLRRHYAGRRRVEVLRRDAERSPARTTFSVVMPVLDSGERLLREAVASVRGQVYPRWQLCIAAGSAIPDLPAALHELAAGDPRVRVRHLQGSPGRGAAANAAAADATGEFLVLLDEHDLLAPDALVEVARALEARPDADLVYSDEDHVDEAGTLGDPFFKPDWCPDSFLSRPYASHLTVLRREQFERLGGFRPEYEGGHLYDLLLRLSEESSRIVHVPRVLYHRRVRPGSAAAGTSVTSAHEASRRALQAAIERRGEPGEVRPVPGYPGCWIVRYAVRRPGRVSIVILTRDQPGALSVCLESVFARSGDADFEVVVVDNGSVEPATPALLERWHRREPRRFRCLALDVPFNFSLLCNHGARDATGDYLLFLNDDTEVITDDWLRAMVEQAQRPTVGAVGALLLYEDGTIQHAGAVLGPGGLAVNGHAGCPGDGPGYAGQVVTVNNYLSVAGTCLMTRRGLFAEMNGFDEALPGDYEDVDLCLRLHERGYRNVYLPHVRLHHFEALTRGRDHPLKDPVLRQHSCDYILGKWKKYVDHDPCYSPNLTRAHTDYRVNVDHLEPAPRPPYDGRRRPKGRFLCMVDEAGIHGERLLVRGWAMGPRGEPLRRVVVRGDGGFEAEARVGLPRPDVYRQYPQLGNREAGFHLYQPLPPATRRRVRLSLELTTDDLTERHDLKLPAPARR